MGDVSFNSPVMGSWARRESSDNSVIVKTPVGLLIASGVLERLKRPISVEAVDPTTSRSCRFGGKSRNLKMK